METIKPIRSPRVIKFYLITLILINYLHYNAQDIKMGYMQLGWLHGYTYSCTTYLLTDAVTNVDRPYILTDWGVKVDTSKLIQTTLINNGFLKKYYGVCTYFGPGQYNISNIEGFRVIGIKNMTSSFNQTIILASSLKIQTFGNIANSAPSLQNNNITLSLQNDSVIFKPHFYDPEGDSLSFQFTACNGSNYYIPNGATIDIYGNLYFHKDSIGIYAFSTIINEWRKNDDGDYITIQSSQLDFIIDITTDVSVSEIKKLSLKLFPNPTTSIINIIDEQNELQNSTIEIKNYLGQTVYYSPFDSQINVSYLSSGMYFLTVQSSSGNKTIKIIKQ